MPQQCPAPMSWNGTWLALVISGGLGLTFALAAGAWVAWNPRPANETGLRTEASVGETVPPSVATSANGLSPLDEGDLPAFGQPVYTDTLRASQPITPNSPNDNPPSGGILQHLATTESSHPTPSAQTSADVPASDRPEPAKSPTKVVRKSLARVQPAEPSTASDAAAVAAEETTEPGNTSEASLTPTSNDYEAEFGEFLEIQNEAEIAEDALTLTAHERFEQDAKRFVSFFNIGWSANAPDKRNIGWGVSTRGWEHFVRFKIKPQVEEGVTRFQLHNPFGAIAGEPMQLDQLLHAQDIELLAVTENFVEAWKPITDQGVEVIAYVGCGTGDPDFDDLPLDQWLERAFASVQPCLDANMSIGLDAAVVAPLNSPTHVFAQKLRERGVKVYVEAKPTRFVPHWFDFNVILLDRNWLHNDMETGHPAAANYGIPDGTITGEVIRMAFPRTNETWENLSTFPDIHSRIRDILDQGHSVSVGAHQWFSKGHTLRDLLYIDDRQAAYD